MGKSLAVLISFVFLAALVAFAQAPPRVVSPEVQSDGARRKSGLDLY